MSIDTTALFENAALAPPAPAAMVLNARVGAFAQHVFAALDKAKELGYIDGYMGLPQAGNLELRIKGLFSQERIYIHRTPHPRSDIGDYVLKIAERTSDVHVKLGLAGYADVNKMALIQKHMHGQGRKSSGHSLYVTDATPEKNIQDYLRKLAALLVGSRGYWEYERTHPHELGVPKTLVR